VIDTVVAALEAEKSLPGHDSYQLIAVYKYLLSISAKKAEERSMKSASFNFISSSSQC
jgi:hypothetical protein